MTERDYTIGVTGDTGFDVFTEKIEGFNSSDGRVSVPDASIDMHVPSGAKLIELALRHFLANANVVHFQPSNVLEATQDFYTTLYNYLIELHKYKSASNVFRVVRTRPLLDYVKIAPPQSFDELLPFAMDPGDQHGQTKEVEDPNRFAQPLDLLVVHDGNGTWRRYPSNYGAEQLESGQSGECSAISLIESMLKKHCAFGAPNVIVNLHHDLPTVQGQGAVNGKLSFDQQLTFWKTLEESPANVCVVVSANTLRREGAAISRRLSWEHTIECLVHELRLFDKLEMLARFKHLVIRFGLSGAVHIQTQGNERKIELVFAPRPEREFYRDATEQGSILNKNIFLVAAISRMISEAHTGPHSIDFAAAIKLGLSTAMHAYDVGYKLPWAPDSLGTGKHPGSVDLESGNKALSVAYQELSEKFSASQEVQYDSPDDQLSKTLGQIAIPEDVTGATAGSIGAKHNDWEILRDVLRGTNVCDSQSDASRVARINVAIAIAMYGHEAVLNRNLEMLPHDSEIRRVLAGSAWDFLDEESVDLKTLGPGQPPSIPTSGAGLKRKEKSANLRALHVPTMKIGKVTVIERHESESIRSVRNLLTAYVNRCRNEGANIPPLSVAVFGPPGSGKSFIVKELARDINASLESPAFGLEIVEYNVSQFSSIDDIGKAITRSSVINNEGKIPLVFFDEFDCSRDKTPLGWLKYFLAPMQDGTFFGAQQTISIARAIFVFAGGVYNTYEDFDIESHKGGRDKAPDTLTQEFSRRLNEFRALKGPDFVSRLRGHMNVSPINSCIGADKPIIRRALILRGLLEKHRITLSMGPLRVSNIDEDIVFALLTVDKFRHGTRSLEAFIETCAPVKGRIEKSSIPPKAQLQMHLDAENFLVRVFRGRFRGRGATNTANDVGDRNHDVRQKSTAGTNPIPDTQNDAPHVAHPGLENTLNARKTKAKSVKENKGRSKKKG